MPNLSGSPDIFDQFIGLMAAHSEMIKKMESMIVPKAPIDQGAFLDEYISQPTSPLIWVPPIDRPALVTNILISFTPVAAATFSVGQTGGTTRTIPIPVSNATFPIPIACAMVIHPGDVFTVSVSGATAVFLEIMGKLLSGTDWSQI